MRAILLSAGLGTRLRPLTNEVPKCLVPINGRPLLDIWLEKLTLSGFGPFLVNTHYLSGQVERYLSDSCYASVVTLLNEPQLLGTAGTLIRNRAFFEETDGLLLHADNYCLADLEGFVYAHQNRPVDCLLTMMTFRTDSPSSCGIVELDERGVVIGFYEKVSSPPGDLANGAIYLLSNEFLNYIGEEFLGSVDFSVDVLPKMLGKIYTYETKEILIDIGTISAYKAACANAV